MKHLKLDFSLVTSKPHGWSKPAGARVQNKLRTWISHPYVCARALGWGNEPCHCFSSFCHALESALASSFSHCHGVKPIEG